MSKPSDKKRLPPWGIGLIAVALTAFAFYMGFTKRLPFTSRGYEVSAVFQNAQNLRVKSPVRVAGVNVGTVTEVKHLVTGGQPQQAAVVKMQIDDDGRPVKEDATMQLRPRLFLEGSLFIDLHPGTPQAPELASGGTIPIAHTSASVQVDQVLTTLQAPVRAELQTFLIEFGNGLDVYGGAEGLRESFKTSPAAYQKTAEVNQAFLGTQPGDLTRFVANTGEFVRALDQPGLNDLITNLATVTSAFGAESNALEAAIIELPGLLETGEPALVKVNSSLPALRAFSREILPGVKSTPATLKAANPFIAQLRGFVSKPELRGLVAQLVPATPSLANLAQQTIPFYEQTRALSSCFNNVVIPWADTRVPSGDGETSDKVYKETGYGLAGLAGESRSGDANGQYIRVGAGSGTNMIATPPIPGEGTTFGQTLLPLLGAEPSIGSSAKTPFHPDDPCENQDKPDLRSGGPVPVPGQSSDGTGSAELNDKNTLPSNLVPFLTQQKAALDNITKGQAQGGVAGKQQAQRGFAELQSFYKDMLPAYQKALRGGGN